MVVSATCDGAAAGGGGGRTASGPFAPRGSARTEPSAAMICGASADQSLSAATARATTTRPDEREKKKRV